MRENDTLQPFPDNFSYVIPVEEEDMLHTATNPFCFDPTCPCHEDTDSIATVTEFVSDGLMTPSEATDFVNGRIV